MPLKTISTVQVIDTLAEITRYHDREVLERSLATTLSELIPALEFRFYKVQVIEDSLEMALLAFARKGIIGSEPLPRNHQIPEELANGILQAVKHGELLQVDGILKGMCHIIYPVFDSHDEIYSVMVQLTDRPNYEDQRFTHGLLRVYSNYLALLEESQKDKLTNLLNRETLDREITKLLINHGRKRNGLMSDGRRSSDNWQDWLCVVDIDHFKRINDQFGHLFGDEVLILLARLFENAFRQDDQIFRFGGEEFVVIFKTLDWQDALAVCERLRQTVEQNAFPMVKNITISIGAVEITDQDGTAGVIDQADKALYFAKEHGRNNVCLYRDLASAEAVEQPAESVSGSVDFF